MPDVFATNRLFLRFSMQDGFAVSMLPRQIQQHSAINPHHFSWRFSGFLPAGPCFFLVFRSLFGLCLLRFRSVFSMGTRPLTGSAGPRGAPVYENMHSPIQSTVYGSFLMLCFRQSHQLGHQNALAPGRFCPGKGVWCPSRAGVSSVILHNCPPVADHLQQNRPSFGR